MQAKFSRLFYEKSHEVFTTTKAAKGDLSRIHPPGASMALGFHYLKLLFPIAGMSG